MGRLYVQEEKVTVADLMSEKFEDLQKVVNKVREGEMLHSD